MSADGSVVVGANYDANGVDEAFRWTAASGIESLGPGGAREVSADGSIATGLGPSGALRWRIGPTGAVTTQVLASSGGAGAYGASLDGSVAVGNVASRAVRWTATGKQDDIGFLPGGTFSVATDASQDGSVAVGMSSGPGFQRAFRWSVAGGIQSLGDLPGGGDDFSYATDVSADGSVVVGYGNSDEGVRYFIWDAMNGMRDLEHLLRDQYGLSVDEWKLTAPSPTGSPSAAAQVNISADGRIFAGTGTTPPANVSRGSLSCQSRLPPCFSSSLPGHYCSGGVSKEAVCVVYPSGVRRTLPFFRESSSLSCRGPPARPSSGGSPSCPT